MRRSDKIETNSVVQCIEGHQYLTLKETSTFDDSYTCRKKTYVAHNTVVRFMLLEITFFTTTNYSDHTLIMTLLRRILPFSYITCMISLI